MEKDIKDFIYFTEFGENKTANTIRGMKKDLSQLREYLVNTEKITTSIAINSVMLRGFLANLVEKGLTKRSINRKLSSIRGFFKYLLRKGIIKQNPAEILESPSFYIEDPIILTKEEIKRLRDVISITTTNGLRDRLILELLYSSGITSVEMLGISEKLFNLDKRELYVTNGKSKRVVFFSQRTREFLKQYVKSKKEKYRDKYNPDILFVNGSGTRLSDRSLRRIIDRYVKKAGIEKEVSPYTFRHTFGVYMLLEGMDILYLQNLMGHITLESTKLYQYMLRTLPVVR